MNPGELARELLDQVREILGDAWNDLPQGERDLAKATAQDLAEVHLAAFLREPVAEDLVDLNAQISVMRAETQRALAAAFRRHVISVLSILAQGLAPTVGKLLALGLEGVGL